MITKIVVLICAAVVFAEGATVKPSPEKQCFQQDSSGTITWYPLYASWSSRQPGICRGYYCQVPNNITVEMCREVHPDCTGDNVCYQIGRNILPFPYCCAEWDCSPDNQRTALLLPCPDQ